MNTPLTGYLSIRQEGSSFIILSKRLQGEWPNQEMVETPMGVYADAGEAVRAYVAHTRTKRRKVLVVHEGADHRFYTRQGEPWGES